MADNTMAQDVADAKDAVIGGVRDAGRAVADRLEQGRDAATDYVRSHDADSMMSDVHVAVRRNPGLSLIIAAALGFVVARLFSGND